MSEAFGRVIAEARKKKGLSQKDLAELIRVEDVKTGKSISPQYLNDIEHDRRNPSSALLVGQFARILDLNADYLAFLADRWPDTLRKQVRTQDQFEKALTAFRKKVTPDR